MVLSDGVPVCNHREHPAVDLKVRIGEIPGDLESAPSIQETETPRPKRRRRWKRWAVPAIFALGLAWMNGPGLRWLVPLAAEHFLPEAGFRGSFKLEGSLTGGLWVKDLVLESDKTLAKLSAGRVKPVYRFSDLIRGRLDGLVVEGLHADLRLGMEEEKSEDKEPLDLGKIVRTLRAAREHFIPLAIDLKDISLKATKDGKPVIALASSRFQHAAGNPALHIRLGAITDANGREWEAREASLVWNADDISLARIDPLPGVSVRDLLLKLPETGEPSAEVGILLDDALLNISTSPGFSSVSVDLREGVVESGRIAERFGLKLPVGARLTSLSVNADGLLPDPMAATGEARLLLEDVVSGDWAVPTLSLDVDMQPELARVAAGGQAFGSGFSLNAEAPVSRSGGRLTPGDMRGRFGIADVPKLVAGLSGRFKVIDPEAPVPPSIVDGGFHVAMKDGRPDSAEASVLLKPAEPQTASSVAVKGRWRIGQPVSGEIELDGVKVAGSYQTEASTYEGSLEAAGFNSGRIDPWLAVVRARSAAAFAVSGTWRGGGDLKSGVHRGKLALERLELSRGEVPPVLAQGGVDYDWPSGFTTRDLRIQTKNQVVSADAQLSEGWLALSNLRWQDGKTAMAGGSAKLPVPEDFSKWRETLANDKRPLELAVESEVLSLALLKDWLPAAAKLDPRSTGKLRVNIAGTYAAPSVDVLIEARELRSPEQPKLPPADLKIAVAGKDGRLSVDGSATAPDFPPAVMTASMPFRPAEWVGNPGLVLEENVSARMDLPRIDLSRFTTLVPGARKLGGVLTGNVEVAGVLRKPDAKGRIDLTGGALELDKPGVPPITGLSAIVDLALDRITLRELKAGVAGGTLQAAGSLTLDDGKPGALDFRVRGDHLPLKRDDSLIVRANADLRLSGNWRQAALTGTAGVVDSIFYRDIELLPIGSPFTAPSAAALPKIDAPAKPADSLPEPFRNWTLDVLARTENPFLIRGNLATGRVDANLRVGGTLGNPTPNGEVRISDFRAELPFSTLTIPSGTLRFTPETGFDPVLEIRGNAEPRPYRVSVFVYGRASDPQLALTSSPPLPENEIMTLLATGATTSGLEDPQQASSRALQLLAEELRRGRFAVGKRLRPLLGLLDRVDFSVAEADPYSSASYSTATLQISDRWYLSAGMGDEGDSRVLGIWRLRFY